MKRFAILIVSMFMSASIASTAQALTFRGAHCVQEWEIRAHVRACEANGMVSNAKGKHLPLCYELKCIKPLSFKERIELRRLYRLLTY